MTNREAILYLSKMLDDSDDVTTKRALSKGITALMNNIGNNSYFQIGEGYPIVYFTSRNIKCYNKNNECSIYADDRPIIKVTNIDESIRGRRYEVVIHDNSVDMGKYNNVILPKIKGDGIEIYDDYDKDISKEVDDKLRELKIM